MVVHWEADDEGEEHEASAVAVEADRPEPGEEDHGGCDDVERDLDHDLGSDKSRPAVHAAWSLADLVDIADVDERHLRLVGQRDGKNGCHEDRLH